MGKAKAKRRHIMDTAFRLFRERGFEQTTMRDIAREADIAVGATYYYFKTKEDLVLAFYLEVLDGAPDQVEVIRESTPDLASRMRAFFMWQLDQLRPYRSLLGVLLARLIMSGGDGEPGDNPQARAMREEALANFARLMEGSGFPIHDQLRPSLPRLCWMGWLGLLLFWLHDRSPNQAHTQTVAEAALELVLGAMMFLAPVGFPMRPNVLRLVQLLDEDRGGEAAP